MADRSGEKLEELTERLRSQVPEERRRAICDMPGGWVPGALEVLVGALCDDDWRVRKEAVRRVAEWPDVDGAVAALLAVLRAEDDVGWRNAVVESLSHIGKPAVGALLEELGGEGHHRKFIVDILGAIGDSEAVAELVSVLEDEDGNLRIAAAEALRDIGNSDARSALRVCLASEDLQLRLAAIDGLASMRAAIPVAEIAPSLELMILRKGALRLLGWTRDREALDPLVDALTDRRPPMRVAAVVATANLIAHLGSEERDVVAPVCGLSRDARANVRSVFSTADLEAKRAAASILGVAGDVESVPLLAEGLVDPEACRACAEAISRLRERAVEPLVAVARDAEGELRVAIFDILSSEGLRGAEVDSVLVSAMADEDEEVAAAAARALGEVAGKGDMPAVLAALEEALEREDVPEVASAAATALGRLGWRGLAPDARRLLERAIESGDPEIRAASALGLAELGDPGVVETLASHLVDEDAYPRLAAIRALANTGEPGRSLLRQRLTLEDDAEMVDAIRAALDEEGGEQGYLMVRARMEMSPEEFEILRELIHHYCGIFFDEDKKYLLQRRLGPRLEVTGARNFDEYARMLRYGSRGRRELEEAVDRVAVNETYFFREEYQLRAFADEILPEIRWDERREKRLSIWSAGCSTGEEPYSISMLILENGTFVGWDVRIIGSDISRRVLRSASRARYRKSSLRETSDARRQRFFREVDGAYQLREDVRAPVAFARLNLLEHQPLDLVGEVDVLFCRNVLIYFDTEVRERVLGSFYQHLAPGGYLLLGHSESLLNLSTAFELVQLEHDTVYRKPRSSAG